MDNDKSATRGDRVRVVFSPNEGFEGTVVYTPGGEGDSWVIHGDSGEITHVQRYESISVLSRRYRKEAE